LTPEFIEWINKQSDLSNFFLYAAQQLYHQTGFVDVSEVMPRKINFELTSEVIIPNRKVEKESLAQEVVDTPIINKKVQNDLKFEDKGKVQETTWSSINNLDDDPYA